jgi:hypothetical protein
MTLMNVTLRPATFKFLLLAAGVLLGLLAVMLLFGPQAAHGAHGSLLDASTKVKIVGKLKPLGVLWH